MIDQRYITLEELMKQVRAELLADLSASMGMLVIYAETLVKEKPHTFVYAIKARKLWAHIEELCHECGLEFSAKTARRITKLLKKSGKIQGSKLQELIDEAKELQSRLHDEMGSVTYFAIEPNKQSLLTGSNLFGEEVTSAFPSATVDIEEAGKCLTFERWTASVFHLMRVMEVGLRVLRSTLQIPVSTNRSWGFILKQCDDALKSSAYKNDMFFTEAIAMLRSVKDAWRNPTMHVENVYTEEQAEDIRNVVKAFMRKLATKLKEDIP